MKIYIVVGHYYDYEYMGKYNVAFYFDEKLAEEHALLATEEAASMKRENQQRSKDFLNKLSARLPTPEIRACINKYDDSGTSETEYSVEEVEVREESVLK